jgi:hypothetical protein
MIDVENYDFIGRIRAYENVLSVEGRKDGLIFENSNI